MRALLAVIVATGGGCYAPLPPDGAPCAADGACPSGLRCDPALGRCVREMRPADAELDLDAALDAGLDAPPLAIDAPTGELLDEFERPDNAAIGNGWIEKHPPTFAIASGEVVRIATSPESYRDNMVYRPASEDVLDVEVSIQFRVLVSPPRYPQVFVRARSATIGAPDAYDGYLLYVNGSTTDQVVLGRQLGTEFVATLSMFTLASSLTPGSTYRLTLRTQGTDPVALAATVELRTGGSWVEIGATAVTDADPARITTAGTVGFAGDEVAAYVFDAFRRRPL